MVNKLEHALNNQLSAILGHVTQKEQQVNSVLKRIFNATEFKLNMNKENISELCSN